MKGKFKTYPVLAPLSLVYRAVMGIRNMCFDKGLLSCRRFGFPVISVGNITVGGTGKTPHVEYLAGLIGGSGDVAVLSRGYGRMTKGFRLADASSDADTVGDEPFQISTRFPDVTVAVDEDRIHGIEILAGKGTRTVILDDAFQHRRVSPSLGILLIDWSRNILDDMVMPAGRMRESASGRRRADIIIFTKCPAGLDDRSMDEAAAGIAVRPEQKVFFTTFSYGELRPMVQGTEVPGNPDILAVAGIARPQPMVSHLETKSGLVRLLSFPDHHRFSAADISRISKCADSVGTGSIIVTTEKDEARLKGMELPDGLKKRIFVLPVRVSFLREKECFDRMILNHIESFKR